jgi:predicted dehydrogenase
MMEATPIRIGIAGVGYWGSILLRTFQGMPSARVTALCDEDPIRLATLANEHRSLACVPTLDALLDRDDVDAVLIVTPPSRHHDMARRALEAGKHVWVEKPLALTAADGRALVDLAACRGRTLFVDHTFLFDPMVSEMSRLIEEGELGDVYHLSLQRLGMGRIRRDSDVWWNSAPHDLSILFRLVPRPIAAVRLHTHAHLQPGIADMAVCDLELAGGTSAHVYLSWLHPEKTAKVVVVGSRRILVYEGRFQQRALTLYDYGLDRSAPPPGRQAPIIPIEGFAGRPVPVADDGEPLASAARDFVDSIRTGEEPLTSGRRMLPVVEALEAADRVATRSGAAG